MPVPRAPSLEVPWQLPLLRWEQSGCALLGSQFIPPAPLTPFSSPAALAGLYWEQTGKQVLPDPGRGGGQATVPQRQQGPSVCDIRELILGCFPAGLTGEAVTAGMGGSSCFSSPLFHNPVFHPTAGHLEGMQVWLGPAPCVFLEPFSLSLSFWTDLSLLVHFPAKRWSGSRTESPRWLLQCLKQCWTDFHGIMLAPCSPSLSQSHPGAPHLALSTEIPENQ